MTALVHGQHWRFNGTDFIVQMLEHDKCMNILKLEMEYFDQEWNRAFEAEEKDELILTTKSETDQSK